MLSCAIFCGQGAASPLMGHFRLSPSLRSFVSLAHQGQCSSSASTDMGRNVHVTPSPLTSLWSPSSCLLHSPYLEKRWGLIKRKSFQLLLVVNRNTVGLCLFTMYPVTLLKTQSEYLLCRLLRIHLLYVKEDPFTSFFLICMPLVSVSCLLRWLLPRVQCCGDAFS